MSLETVATRRRYLHIAESLADTIRSEGMARGSRLPSERELATQFDVSRQTVREALIALEVGGVVEIRLGSGVYVLNPVAGTAALVQEDAPGPFEILEARRVFEGESAALAAERISNEELQKLKALLRQMEISYQEREPEDIERYDRRFHLAIAEASRNSAIVTTIDWLWTLRSRSEISRFFHKKVRDQGSKPNLDDHSNILESLTRRDVQGSRERMQSHIAGVLDAFSEFALE